MKSTGGAAERKGGIHTAKQAHKQGELQQAQPWDNHGWNNNSIFFLKYCFFKSVKLQEIRFLTFLNFWFFVLLCILVDEVCWALSLWQESLLHRRTRYLWPIKLSTENHQWEEKVRSWASHFGDKRLGQLRKGLLLNLWVISWLQIQHKSLGKKKSQENEKIPESFSWAVDRHSFAVNKMFLVEPSDWVHWWSAGQVKHTSTLSLWKRNRTQPLPAFFFFSPEPFY